MFWKKREPDTLLLQRYQAFFTTVDGVKHEGRVYKWCDSTYSVREYLMERTAGDGYLKDRKGLNMYPLQNILSIQFEVVEEKIVLDNFYHEYKMFFTDEEVKKMKEWQAIKN